MLSEILVVFICTGFENQCSYDWALTSANKDLLPLAMNGQFCLGMVVRKCRSQATVSMTLQCCCSRAPAERLPEKLDRSLAIDSTSSMSLLIDFSPPPGRLRFSVDRPPGE
jgi:hypothetical protein